jgi:Mrp family chromosome partitioning ATPase
MHKAGSLTVVAVSSPGPGDGKTTTAINLAASLAEGPAARVLLIDVDWRWSSLNAQLGLGSGGPGLADAIARGWPLDRVARRGPSSSLAVVPAGRSLATPYELLDSPRLGELLEEARQTYEYVVVDAPALVPVPDCRILARWVDGFLIVLAAHRTPRRLLADALDVMDPAKLIGLVFNGDDAVPLDYRGARTPGRSSVDPRAHPRRRTMDRLRGWLARRQNARRGRYTQWR